MEVFLVFESSEWEGSHMLGVFSDYEKAVAHKMHYAEECEMDADGEYNWIEIRKVEIDKDYGIGSIGEEV